ncbi:MAG: hypothetical protein ACLPWF_19945 [Bryobacteraceae bacterium]
MTKNLKGLLKALQQSINEAILESNDVAAAMAALKRTGKCPVFTIDISMQDAPPATRVSISDAIDLGEDDLAVDPMGDPKADPIVSGLTEDLVLSDWDVQFLGAIGISDPSWCQSASSPSKD